MFTGGSEETGNDGWAGRYYRTATQSATPSNDSADPATPRERGARRKKLYEYIQAANDLRQSYVAGYTKGYSESTQSREINSEGWPEVATVHGDGAELMLFPSYGRLQPPPAPEDGMPVALPDGMREEWKLVDPSRRDFDATVEVDVKGWLYVPHSGPLNRKSRYALWVARQLCGLPAESSAPEPVCAEEEEYARQTAVAIDRSLREADGRGFTTMDGQVESTARQPYQRVNPPSNPPQPTMSPAELKAAHAAFNSRLAPFTYRPISNAPVTIFFYNDKQSQSRQLLTSDNGHFSLRAELSFIPSHVRVLATEYLSATEEVCLHPPDGISLISDIDDTVKHSNITMGTREIFKNTFTAPLPSLSIPGVAQWYRKLHSSPYNVSIHYVSNSPWQLYPLLRSFFEETGLPPGSFHLKQYSGMLQGIFEPVAERKRGTVERVIHDFPHRKWLLVGDSGEQDLEVYTEMAERWPNRILAICIRDITTTTSARRQAPVGETTFDPHYQTPGASHSTPNLNRNVPSGDLIDFSDDTNITSNSTPSVNRRPIPSPRPQRLCGNTTGSYPSSLPSHLSSSDRSFSSKAPPPPPPRKPETLRSSSKPPKPPSLSSCQQSDIDPFTGQPRPVSRASTFSTPNNSGSGSGSSLYDEHEYGPPSHPPSRLSTPPSYLRRATTAITDGPVGNAAGGIASHLKVSQLAGLAGMASAGATAAGVKEAETVINKREDLWKRRWEGAQERLNRVGVRLFSWREGGDVEAKTIELVERELGIGKGARR